MVIEAKVHQLASQALRTLAVAYKPLKQIVCQLLSIERRIELNFRWHGRND